MGNDEQLLRQLLTELGIADQYEEIVNRTRKFIGVDIERTTLFREQKLVRIDLSRLDLTTLPDTICKFTNLERIFLEHNQLTTLPRGFTEFQQLKVVDLRNNSMEVFPSQLLQLRHLNRLYLDNNPIGRIPNEISQLNQLIVLDMTNTALQELPDGVCELSDLEQMYVNHNQLVAMPTEMGKLASLKYLNLTDNQLSSLPHSFWQLSQLEMLDIRSNRVNFDDEKFEALNALKDVFLDDNNLHSVPTGIFALTDLKNLSLSNNPIMRIPEDIGKLTSLSSLYMRNTGLSNLDPVLCQLPELYTLDLSDNKLQQFPDYFSKISYLGIVNLKNNELSQLPSDLDKLKNLQQLDLEHNPLVIDYEWIANSQLHTIKTLKLVTDDVLLTDNRESITSYPAILIPSQHLADLEIWMTHQFVDHAMKTANTITVEFIMLDKDLNQILQGGVVSGSQLVRENIALVYNVQAARPSEKEPRNWFSKNIDVASWVYLLLGLLLVVVMTSALGDTSGLIVGIWVELVVVLFFVFQIYTGFTIQEYADSLIERVENSQSVVRKLRFKPAQNIAGLLVTIATKLRSSFGLLVVVVWFTSLRSTVASTESIATWNFDLPFIEIFTAFWLDAKQALDTLTESLVFPDLSFLSLGIFSGISGITLRVLGILAIFWSISKGGWGQLIHPSFDESEEREQGLAQQDWYETAALPIGIMVAVIALIIDGSDLAELPIILFQLGLVIGGIIHFLVNKNHRMQMVLGALYLLVGWAAVLAVGSIAFSISLIPRVVGAALVTVVWVMPFRTKPSIFRLLGRPYLKGQPPSKVWRRIAKESRFNIDPFGVTYHRLRLENIRSFDLVSLATIVVLYLATPILIWALLLRLPVGYQLLLVVFGLFLWYFIGLPPVLRRVNFEPRQKMHLLYTSKFGSGYVLSYEEGLLRSLYLTNRHLTRLPSNIFNYNSLKVLSVSNNHLTIVPLEITKLDHLDTLDISQNQITHLPEEIGELKRLSALKARDNMLTKLPVSITKLQTLELDLRNNKIDWTTEQQAWVEDLKKRGFVSL